MAPRHPRRWLPTLCGGFACLPVLSLSVGWGAGAPLSVNLWHPKHGAPAQPQALGAKAVRWFRVFSRPFAFWRWGDPLSIGPSLQKKKTAPHALTPPLGGRAAPRRWFPTLGGGFVRFPVLSLSVVGESAFPRSQLYICLRCAVEFDCF